LFLLLFLNFNFINTMGFKSFFKKLKGKINYYNETMVSGLQLFFKAHNFILANKLKRYLFISGFFFLVLFSIGINWLLNLMASIESPTIEWAIPKINIFFNFTDEELRQGFTAVFWILRKTIIVNKDAIFLFIFMIIGTPYFSFISSKTEELINGKTYPFKWKIFIGEIRRGLKISIRNTFKQLLFFIAITLIAFIPYMFVITPLATFIVQAYYNGVLITDYSLERNQFTIKESEQYYKKNKTSMFTIGLGFMFLLLIPVIGWFVAPTYALVASAFYFLKVEKD